MEEATRSEIDLGHRMQLQYSLEQFYYDEAALLDERLFSEWLDLFAEEAHYWMPIRRTRLAKDKEQEFTRPGDMAYFDDNKEMLSHRAKKLESGRAWSENPPSRSRHLINNVRVLEDSGETLRVTSNFHLYRVRFESDEDNWFGRREDLLVRRGDSFLIKERSIFLEQTVILSRNMSVLF